MLYSDSINWQGRRFFKITEFLKILNKENTPDYDKEIKREEKSWVNENIGYHIKDMNQLNEE